MKPRFVLPVVGCALALAALGLRAQPSLQQGLKDTNIAVHWIYDDFAKAVTQAKATGKPLLVNFRCVP